VGTIPSLLSGPLKGVFEGIAAIIGKFVKDPTAALQSQTELAQIEAQFQMALLDADKAFAAEQAKVLVAEATSESWLTRNWRPILMLSFTAIVVNNFIIAPTFSVPVLPIPDHMWELLKIGIGGYIVGRSIENVASYAPDVATALKKK
jgi:hypothetical protein